MNDLFLAQSDTTAGFLSQNADKINAVKQRKHKPILLEVDGLETLKHFVRIPQKYKNLVRRAKKTTFIYPNKIALRVVKDPNHLRFLSHFKWMYSSSANLSAATFDLGFATQHAEVIIQDWRGIYENAPSKIYKITTSRCKRIRA